MTHVTRLGRLGVIALAAVIVAALGGAGILAGALFEPAAQPLAPARDHSTARGVAAGGGPAATPRSAPSPAAGVSGSSPSPPPPPGGGGGARIDTGPLRVEMPAGWRQFGSGAGWAVVVDGAGDVVYVRTTRIDDTTVDSGTVLREMFAEAVPPERYSAQETGPVVHRIPFGQVLIRSVMAYRALFIDDQAAESVFGNIWVGIRKDGTVLTMTAETIPQSAFDDHYARYVQPAYAAVWETFAHAPLPPDARDRSLP